MSSEGVRKATPREAGRGGRLVGFTMVELLVVIAIIALLVGLLLAAMTTVRDKANRTATMATMQGFGQACDSFQLEHGFYPGVVPETILAQSLEAMSPGSAGSDSQPWLSGAENALLHLMGGFVTEEEVGTSSFDNDYTTADGWSGPIQFTHSGGVFRIKVNTFEIGSGPVIGGVKHAPYFTPADRDREFGFAIQTITDPSSQEQMKPAFPDLLDAWGQPIAYARQARSVGDLAGAAADRPQFLTAVLSPYVDAGALGQLGAVQNFGQNPDGSLFSNSAVDRHELFAQILRHPALGQPDAPLGGTPRGAYVVMSAGTDGIFYSTRQAPDPNAVDEVLADPRVLEEFDDLVFFGGGR